MSGDRIIRLLGVPVSGDRISLKDVSERESFVLSEGGITVESQVVVGEFVTITVAERDALVEAVEAARVASRHTHPTDAPCSNPLCRALARFKDYQGDET